MLSALEQPGAERACVEMADAYPRSETEHEAEAGEALLDSELASQAQQGAFRREAKAGPQVLGVSDKLPRLWRHHALGILVMLVLTAFGLAVAAYVFNLEEIFEGRKVTFFVVGDWGRNGQFNQSLVAAAMAKQAKKQQPLFIISTGDNFYESGLTSPDDQQFQTSFTDVYRDEGLQVPWWAVLGNHDYGEMWNVSVMPTPPNCNEHDVSSCFYGPLSQLNARLTQRDWRWHCERWFQRSVAKGAVDIFFIDTSPAIVEYHQEVWAGNHGGILEQSWEAQVLELEGRLAASKATWKLVVGHHPVLNNHWPPNPVLTMSLQPLLESISKASSVKLEFMFTTSKWSNVHAYFSGHEHMLQHHHAPGAATHYIVSGGGSLTDYDIHYLSSPASKLQYPGSGFVSCVIDQEAMECSFHGIKHDKPIYNIHIPLHEPDKQ